MFKSLALLGHTLISLPEHIFRNRRGEAKQPEWLSSVLLILVNLAVAIFLIVWLWTQPKDSSLVGAAIGAISAIWGGLMGGIVSYRLERKRDADAEKKQAVTAAMAGESGYFQHVNFQGGDLRGAHLGYADLRYSNMRATKLANADLHGADLREADLRGADLHRADLTFANLKGTILDNTTQVDSKWRLVWGIINKGASKRDLCNSDLQGAYLREVDLSEANLTNANLRGADLHGANLLGADLHEAILFGASLGATNLTNADLRGANLEGVNVYLQGMNLNGAKYSSTTKWPVNYPPPPEAIRVEETSE